jgi:superfamily II DNA or RNA helicase
MAVDQFPLTRVLARDVAGGSRTKGRLYHLDGAVTKIEGDAWTAKADVRGSHVYRVRIERADDLFTASCECPYYLDRVAICKHIWATLLEAERRGFLTGDGSIGPDAALDPVDPDADTDPEFRQPAAADPALRASTSRPHAPLPWERFLNEFSRHLSTDARTARTPRFAGAQLIYAIDRAATLATGVVAIELMTRHRRKTGDWAKPKPAQISLQDLEEVTDPIDRDVLPLLFGAVDTYGSYTNFGRSSFRLAGPLLDRVLPEVAKSGRAMLRLQRQPEEFVPLEWDDGPPWVFRLDVVHASRDESFSIDGALVRGGERLPIREPSMVLSSGYLFHRGRVARLDAGGAFAWLAQLRGSGAVSIPPDATGRLVDVLARSGVDPSDLPPELQFEIVAVRPRPSVSVRTDPQRHPAASLSATVTFDYEGLIVSPDAPGSVFDQARRRLVRRDAAFEQQALAQLSQAGFARHWDYLAARQGYAIAPSQLAHAVRTLVPAGWRIEAEGRAFRPARTMTSEVRSGIDWFELHGTVDFGEGLTAALPRLLEAVRQGHTTVRLDDGSEGMVPEEWLRRFAGIASAGEASGDHVRFKGAQAALLDAALARMPSVHLDERFMLARDELATFGGLTPLDPAASFTGRLRDYQRDALGWFAFLRRFGFGGCLADDMGLGKTVMVLAWLDRLRAMRELRGPSLVVVPRSVLFNWVAEAARFAPQLRVLDFSGAGRSVDQVAKHHVVLTTYGTLRRDALMLKDVAFDYAVLDEAQAIKNAGTAAAKAARLVRGSHRLALSGTPIENHLGELWSLFEFLNPGLLGSSSAFARHGAAAARRDPEALDVLARGVRPFILRRTKAQVAPELPPRTELTIRCELPRSQRELYDELRDHYRARLLTRIAREGIQKSKMHVLEALLRLRQAACHPGLVDPKRADEPSAKFDALVPHLAEVIDERHKCLVFSQFTSLLALLKTRLDAEGMRYEYLDGRTRDRQTPVTRFQEDPDSRLFLISLKAGGLGLNLTAAEYVFLLDPWWNPAVEAQAIDRAHRIGQARHVFAYRLLAANTVEDKIVELQATKRDLADAIVRADEGLLRSLSRDDLEILLG